ncbi:hypothetical protein BDV35DRAFT_66793 [Aspergillus flavus]|uniref:Uncharacterized protein n=1 Tax=Aspergillus flavus TaxID=5059 RepID=A0A5N6H8X9_ASPFL|nr:hypothetical protein BDV35DRAFT_66793 [Aspergillus flavus]
MTACMEAHWIRAHYVIHTHTVDREVSCAYTRARLLSKIDKAWKVLIGWKTAK